LSDEVLRPNPQVVLTEMRDGTAVLLHMDTRFYFTLNATGVFVWKLLASKRDGGAGWDRASLATEITREFEVDLPTATSDLSTLLEMLRAEELLAPPPK
jgi:hypothetical protein